MVVEGEVYCIVCMDEQGRLIRVHCWEEGEGAQALLRLAAA
jgi:hypothetical protein